MYAYLQSIHVHVWQKPTQYCKAIILHLKINLKNILKTTLEKFIISDICEVAMKSELPYFADESCNIFEII